MEKKESESSQLKERVSSDSLKYLAIYLEGIKAGKGNLLPLGTIVLDDLWKAIRYLQGDVRFTCPELEERLKNK